MNHPGDRRDPESRRVPFDALVEIGGALGPTFDAQAVDLSCDGMQLKTAYLPELGQQVTCRFDAGTGFEVSAVGEVIWNREAARGGEFGIRFLDLEGESAESLRRILMASERGDDLLATGARVRLHIDALAAPMRARVRQSSREALTAYSELGFLQVGQNLELEQAGTGVRRAARLDTVEVEIDPKSRVPQLVVTLRYDDLTDSEATKAAPDSEPLRAPSLSGVELPVEVASTVYEGDDAADDDAIEASHQPAPPAVARARTPQAAPRAPSRAEAHDEPIEAEDDAADAEAMKSPVARAMAKATPAMIALASRTKTAMALMWAKRRAPHGASASDSAPRRTTAPPPTGALHSAGRKVVRSAPVDEGVAPEAARLDAIVAAARANKRKIAIGGGVGLATILMMVALHKPAADAPIAAAPAEAADAAAALPVVAPAPAPDPQFAAAADGASSRGAIPVAAVDDTLEDDGYEPEPARASGRPKPVAPFGDSRVQHGVVLRLKMDGRIERIQGASQPTGFVVSLPRRRSLQPAGPLAAQDARLASLRVVNEPGGAELTATFKDGVPRYLVRAKGDELEIVLARGAVADARDDSARDSEPESPPRRRLRRVRHRSR